MKKEKLIPLEHSRLRDVMERNDANGERVPFSISYVAQNGAVINIEQPVMVCIKPDVRHRRHLIKSIVSDEVRWVRDCLVLRVNNSIIEIR